MTRETLRKRTQVSKVVFALLILSAGTSSCRVQSQAPMFKPAPESPLAVGSQPADVVLEDVNSDGNLDIVTANAGSDDVTVLFGNGRGGFVPAPNSPFPGGVAPHLIAAGDLNGDGHLDLALIGHDSNNVIVLLGNGQGSFTPAPDLSLPSLRRTPPHNHGLTLGDVNGDAALDILTVNQNDNSVSVLLGDGHGGFSPAPASPFPVGRMPYLSALADVNGDNKPDIVTPNARDDDVTILLGNGNGNFKPLSSSPFAVAERPYSVALGDLNGDDSLDVVTAHAESSLITILLGHPGGGFRPAPASPFDAGLRGYKLQLGDINRDGRLDLVTSGTGDHAAVLLGNGRGVFTPAPGSPFTVGPGPWGVALGDLNHDGKLDLVTANSEGNNVTILLAN